MPISGTDHALTEARVGMMRVGGSRVGYVLPIPAITVNATVRTNSVRIAGLSIRDILNGTPNTATLRVSGFTPTEGQEVILAFGSGGPTQFRGRILSTNKIYEGKPANVAWDCECISEEWLLNRRKVTKRWQTTSATVILTETVTLYTSGFSAAGIAPGLPVLDEFTATNEDVTNVFDRVCQRIGEDWQLDYNKVLHVPAQDGFTANAITDSNQHGMSGIAVHTHLGEVRTRQSGEGGGSAASTDVAVDQTTIPVDDSTWYNASGGMVKSGPQFITYTGKSTIDGTGSKVGGKTGLAPGIPTATVVSETSGNLSVGDYRYAVSFVINGGETEAGNNSSAVTIAHVSAPAGAGTGSETTGGSLTALGFYSWVVTFVTAAGETVASVNSSTLTLTGTNNAISLTSIPTSTDDRVTKRRIYRTAANQSVAQLDIELNDNSTTTATLTKADTALGVVVPQTNTSGSGRIDLSNIPIGPAGTTARELYRSPVNIVSNSGYKGLATISNNTATTYSDNIADSELGDALPLVSTVGPLAGDTSLPTQECGAHASGGGWVSLAGQLVRYTGRSASSGAGTLIGVPISGIGAITAAVPYDTPIINHPHLTGVSGIVYAINKGDDVNIWVTRNDTAAQTFMASAVGGDGIHEADVIQDRRMSETEIIARCDAKLEELSTPLVTVRYITRDITTVSGRDITITLGAPTSISGTFRIQSVTTTGFAPVAHALAHGTADYRPLRHVECSSRRLSFEQILRLIPRGQS